MKFIKLNELGYEREIISASVDESKVEFKNGIALVKAEIFVRNPYSLSRLTSSVVYGLINENFEELFSTNLKNGIERNLMFTPYNLKIERFGDNDFLVCVLCGDDSRQWNEYKHIKLVDGVPTLIGEISVWKKTSNENVIITGYNSKRLYDLKTGKYITPELSQIRESEEQAEIFDVVATIKSDADDPFMITENLIFKIDIKGRKITPYISNINGIENGASFIEDIDETLLACKTNINKLSQDIQGLTLTLDAYMPEYELTRKKKSKNN